MSQTQSKILLVTQDQEAIKLLTSTFKAIRTFQVLTASNPEKGIEFMKAHESSIVLLIVDEFGGLQFNMLIEKWVEHKQWFKIPLILLTEEVTFAKLKQCKEHYIHHVLVKPLEKQNTFEKLKAVLKVEQNLSNEFIEKIRNAEFFMNFKLDEIKKLMELGFVKKFEAGQVLIREEGTIDKLGIILEGEVGVYRIHPSYEPLLLTELKACALLGETTLLSRERSRTRVVSHTPSLVFMLPYFAIQLFPDELRERLLRVIIRTLTQKLRALSQDMAPFPDES
ncbi:MAG: cyclic nucleotide-binding domain-containing protein [SAR324 cluster bacterium]|nr:cyclic nucleotide-binding domain-containing protein [SAR324 cluster bacterium]MBF0350630.1 cyclic nucleotide-binding domain-containing protein [SAR324 cluster bacterium]